MDFTEQTAVLEQELDPDLRSDQLINVSRTDRLAAQIIRLIRQAMQLPKPIP